MKLRDRITACFSGKGRSVTTPISPPRLSWEEQTTRTLHHLDHPETGDRFHEMYSCWVWVVEVTPTEVVYAAAGALPTYFPDRDTFHVVTRTEFAQRFRYKTREGSPLQFVNTDANCVKGWAERARSGGKL